MSQGFNTDYNEQTPITFSTAQHTAATLENPALVGTKRHRHFDSHESFELFDSFCFDGYKRKAVDHTLLSWDACSQMGNPDEEEKHHQQEEVKDSPREMIFP